MSASVAIDNIRLEPAARWGHAEYSLEYHRALLERRSGIRAGDPEFARRAYDACGIDFLWHTNDGLVDWNVAGRTTDMGHADYAADGSDRRAARPSPFRDEHEVWAFDAVAEYGLPGREEQTAAYEDLVQSVRRTFPGQLVTGGYYRTLVSGAIAAFGWDAFLAAAASPPRIEKVLDTFFRRTLFFMEAWADTTVDVVIQHDDFVWAAGPFLDPGFIRCAIVPRYAELWRPLRAAGKRVLFCSDGTFVDFAADIAEAGAAGLIFEPCNSFRTMAERFGDDLCLVGSRVDCRDLAAGRWDTVRRAVDATIDDLQLCRGAIVAVGNHLAPNIPADMLDRYFDYLLPRLVRADLRNRRKGGHVAP